MKPAPIPPFNLHTFAGALADVVRASAVWGAESTQKDPDQRTYVLVVQCVAQLTALTIQRDPTEAELETIFAQLGNAPPG